MVVVLVLGERGDVYVPTLAATPLVRVSLAVGRWCRPGRSYARRWRGSRYVSPVWRRRCCPTPQGPRQQSCHGPCSRPVPPVPAWSVMPYPQPPRQRSCHGGCYPGPAPLHAVRVQQGDAPSLRSVTLPAWPLPAFRSATVFPRAPHLSRAVLRPRFARARPAPGAPWSAMSNVLDTATRFPSSPLRGSPDPRADARLRRCHTSCEALPVVRTWLPRSAACAPAAPALRTRNRGRSCERSSPASSRPRVAHGTCLKPSSAPTPHAERRADAACSFRCPLPPSPAAPTQTTPAKLSWSVLHAPALPARSGFAAGDAGGSRLPCGTCTAPSVGAGWLPGQPRSGFRGVALGATSSSL